MRFAAMFGSMMSRGRSFQTKDCLMNRLVVAGRRFLSNQELVQIVID